MNVFVLCTGRCGSVSFIEACKHIQNYACGHESRTQSIGEDRLDFPENHIEADNRLSWFLGKLDAKYGQQAFYVHLLRDHEKTAESFNRRWNKSRMGIIDAYGYGILMQETIEKKEAERLKYCRDYCETVTTNIACFLKDKPQKMILHLEKIKEEFPVFWERIGAEGELEQALKEFDSRHNEHQKQENNPFVSWLQKIRRSIASR